MNFLIRTVAVAIATAAAAWLLPGIVVSTSGTGSLVLTLLAVSLIMGLVNAVVKPLVSVVSGCLIIVTLGLFLLVINAAMLLLTSWLAGQVGLGFYVDGFLTALLGSIVISIVSGFISWALKTD